MMKAARHGGLIELDVAQPVWDRFFWVAPLVLVGTREANGSHRPRAQAHGHAHGLGEFLRLRLHATAPHLRQYRTQRACSPFPTRALPNWFWPAWPPRRAAARRTSPRLAALPVFPASVVDGELLEGGYLFLECELDRIVDGFGENSLIVGRVAAAQVDTRSERRARSGRSAAMVLQMRRLLAYLHPGRFADDQEAA
jgi:hypothetical protein